MKTIIIVILFLLGFLFLLINLPVFIIMLIAKMYMVNISFKESWRLHILKIDNKGFLRSMAKFQKYNIPISFDQMFTHRLAGGDFDNCLGGILYAKENNLDVDILTVFTIDLAGRNVKESFANSNQVYNIELTDLKNSFISIDYYANYKYKFPSAFIDKDPEKVKEKIERKINNFLDFSEDINMDKINQMIKNQILNKDFWKNELGIILIEQNLIIKQR